MAHLFDFQIPEYPMMTVAAVAQCEQAEEQEDVANADKISERASLSSVITVPA